MHKNTLKLVWILIMLLPNNLSDSFKLKKCNLSLRIIKYNLENLNSNFLYLQLKQLCFKICKIRSNILFTVFCLKPKDMIWFKCLKGFFSEYRFMQVSCYLLLSVLDTKSQVLGSLAVSKFIHIGKSSKF